MSSVSLVISCPTAVIAGASQHIAKSTLGMLPLANLTDGLTRSERLLTMSVIEGKPKQTTTTVLTARKHVCTVCLSAFACVSVSDQRRLASALGGIYAKIIKHSFPSNFQNHSFHAGILLTGKRSRKNKNTHLFLLLQMQTLTFAAAHSHVMCRSPEKNTVWSLCY